jgi:hypothetical protein
MTIVALHKIAKLPTKLELRHGKEGYKDSENGGLMKLRQLCINTET